MKIGIRLHDTALGTLPERLSFARTQGFCCAHTALSKVISSFDMSAAPELLTDDFASEIKNDFCQSGMDCAVLGCYLNLADPVAERREKTQQIYMAHLRFAAMIGAGVVGTETYANPESVFSTPAPVSEEAYQLFVDSLRPVIRCAEETDTVLAVEPVYSHIISTPERAERMLNDINSDHIQIILDTVNLISPEMAGREEDVIDDAVNRFGERIRVLHMKDYQPSNGKIVSMACGLGQMRYKKLLSFGMKNGLPMTLEDTKPENAEQARRYLEGIGQDL
ncbi:MAG: sugar phosphate isomerase/epimerase [Clostridiales bacterium]|nr:sugar phosphate isomerase/epimerase [Clostridiales bacterium]